MKRQIKHLKILILLVAAAAQASDRDHLALIRKPDNVETAISQGIKYLAENQHKQGYFNGPVRNVYTALACMAFMADGHIPGRSPYGKNLRNGILFLARESIKEKGYFGNGENGRMYAQGICTLALCEAYGMLDDEKEDLQVRDAIQRALRVITRAQAMKPGPHFGGWRYTPDHADADLSVTAWQILALRSAQNCQLPVPQSAIDAAARYVRHTYQATAKAFTYQHTRATPSMRAAGVVCMLALGANLEERDKAMVVNSASFLQDFDPATGNYYWYQSYYVATAANMMGPEYRDKLLPRLEKVLLELQMPNGEFKKHSGHRDQVYSTAFAVICLCVRRQYLPVYQE